MLENPECDPEKRFNTYRQFSLMNRLVCRWRHLYRRLIRPALEKASGECSLLDIGFGGGDVPLRLFRWANADGIRLRVTAIDRNPRALEFVKAGRRPSGIEFLCGSVTELLKDGRTFDVVISNHILHEMDSFELSEFLRDADVLSNRLALCNDIVRSAAGYRLLAMTMGLWFRNSYLVGDGLLSIRRGYTIAELRSTVPAGWDVCSLFPFHVLAIREKR